MASFNPFYSSQQASSYGGAVGDIFAGLGAGYKRSGDEAEAAE
jgi:hypothetical protein